ncbi:hypothetical protein BDR07DRAFT_1054108 [Suillus spraguei]|nr:hypothetical protein BDR07DRAFT_1054108 [Suillus spraguei]
MIIGRLEFRKFFLLPNVLVCSWQCNTYGLLKACDILSSPLFSNTLTSPQLLFTMMKRKASRDLTEETRIFDSEPTARESGSHRPHNKVRRVRQEVEDGVGNLPISRSNDSRPVLPNVYHERASSTPNLEVQGAPSDAEMDVDTELTPQDAEESAKRMHPLSQPAMTAQDARADLNTSVSFQDTHFKPIRIFDDVHPYTKMALAALACSAKIIRDHADCDEAICELVEKICKVYDFISQDDMLDKIKIPSMRATLGKISQQTRECANFIKNYSETKKFCES